MTSTNRQDAYSDWLVQLLIDRCKEGIVVDKEDLALILNLNLEREEPIQIPVFGGDYGELIQELGRAVVAKGGVLTVPNLQDYDQTETLKAPSDWLEYWSNDDTIPSRFDLSVVFDRYTATTPEGGPAVMDGPGTPTLEAYEAHTNEQFRILRERRERRNSTRSGKP